MLIDTYEINMWLDGWDGNGTTNISEFKPYVDTLVSHEKCNILQCKAMFLR
jgi:hypothetical protein